MLPDNRADVKSATWDGWRDIYAEAEAWLRPEGYSARAVKERVLADLDGDGRVFPVYYIPGRKDQKTGLVSELVRPSGWEKTTPGGLAVDEPKWSKAVMAGWVQGERWTTVDVDDAELAAAAGITPAVLVDAGAMIVLTPSGGCHGIFEAVAGQHSKSKIKSVDGTDYLTGGRYIHSPWSWRPEHTDRGKVKAAGLYLPLWERWSPVPLPDDLYRMVVLQAAKSSTTGGWKGDVDGWNPDPSVRPQWAQLQDAAVKLRKRHPDITEKAAAEVLWKRHQEGWLPNEDATWPWDLAEFESRVRNAVGEPGRVGAGSGRSRATAVVGGLMMMFRMMCMTGKRRRTRRGRRLMVRVRVRVRLGNRTCMRSGCGSCFI